MGHRAVGKGLAAKPRAAPDTPRAGGVGPESCRWDLNPGPRPYQGRALPTEPRQHVLEDNPRGLVLSSAPAPRVLTRVPPRFVRHSASGRAGDGNRTHVVCLEGRYSTIELHPRRLAQHPRSEDRLERPKGRGPRLGEGGRFASVKVVSGRAPHQVVHRRNLGGAMGGAGFEPAKAMPPDLQSGPFSHLGIHPVSDDPRASPKAEAQPDRPELAVRVELTTAGLQNRCSAD